MTHTLTESEQQILNKWLEDPYNKLQFDKITSTDAFLSKTQAYKRFNAKKAWKKIEKTKSKKNRNWIGYAAAILIPIGIALPVLNKAIKDANKQVPNIVLNTKDVSGDVVLSVDGGSIYTLGTKDTLISVGQTQIQSNPKELSYHALKNSRKTIFNTLHIPGGVQRKVTLDDGTEVWLNSKTKFRYPVNFIAKNREVFIEEGEAYFNVAHDKKRPFIVNFGRNKVKVLGTEFNIKSYKNESSDLITLTEGSIELQNKESVVKMTPNQQISITKSNNDFQVRKVEGSIYSAWRNGVYVYSNQVLDVIMTDLERDYDIKIFYQSQDLKKYRFSLKVNRKLPVQKILSAIEEAGEVRIDIKNDNVILMKK